MAKKQANKEQKINNEAPVIPVDLNESDGSIALMVTEEEADAINEPNDSDAALVERVNQWESNDFESAEQPSNYLLSEQSVTTAPLAGVVLVDHVAPERGPTGEDAPVGVPLGYVDPQFREKSVEQTAYERFRARIEGNFPAWEYLTDAERAGFASATQEAQQKFEGLSDFQRHVVGIICYT